MSRLKDKYIINHLPYLANNEKFAIPYIPDTFTKEELRFLRPFFTNTDKPLFVVKNLPSEVKGALASRYSRSVHSLRRLFLKEYIDPIIHPQLQKDWEERTKNEKKEAEKLKALFFQWIEFVEKNGDMETVVNVQRGRAFFDKWLAQYGDDSIAELGAELVCIEGLSNIATVEIEDKRVGISPLEKSSRYVQFWEKRTDGNFQYIVPGELRATKYERPYREVMDLLFQTYADIAEPYAEYVKKLYPQGEDETERSFVNSRGAKRFDDIRDLLPFGTQTNMAMLGNGRAFEDLLSHLLSHSLGELRWWGQLLLQELEKVVPSFVARPKTERGGQAQLYRKNIQDLRQQIASSFSVKKERMTKKQWVKLVSYTKKAEDVVLASFLFQGNQGISLDQLVKKVQKLPIKKKEAFLEQLFLERQFGRGEYKREADRFRKVPRAFENAYFLFDLWARGGDYRDLHRHRQATQEHQLYTTAWGYDLEKEVLKSEFISKVEVALKQAANVFAKIEKFSPQVAQYVVPFGYIQHWYMNLTAREIYWMVELRTGPQGRPHYREICQQIGMIAKKTYPSLFQGLLIDMHDYSLSRRESEKKIDKKLKSLGK